MWQGNLLRKELKAKGLAPTKLAAQLGVSRTAVNDWIRGSVPRGQHLVSISRILGVSPDSFFIKDSPAISMPVHRRRLAGKITDGSRDASFEGAREYLNFFRNAKAPLLRFTVDNVSTDKGEQLALAHKMRALAGLNTKDPIGYRGVFRLYEELTIVAVFRDFPNTIKAYAFYSNIYGHRVVFIDIKTNLIDLIFALLHEAVHAIVASNKRAQTGFYEQIEEEFCDRVAGFIQFPPTYIDSIVESLRGLSISGKVNTIKVFSHEHNHANYGIAKIIKESGYRVLDNIDLRVFAGADSSIRKKTPSIGDCLFESDDPKDYVRTLKALSPLFAEMLQRRLKDTSITKVAEWLDIENVSDVKHVVEELKG